MLPETDGSAPEAITKSQFLDMASSVMVASDDVDENELPFLAQLLSMKVSNETKEDVERQRLKGWAVFAVLYSTMFFTTLTLVSSCCTTMPSMVFLLCVD